MAAEARPVSVAGCTGLDLATSRTDAQLRGYVDTFVRERLGNTDMHPDAWGPIFVRDPQHAPDRLAEVAGDLYTYRQLDDFSHELERQLQSVLASPADRTPNVAKVSRSGVLPERIFVDYAQQRLAEAKLQPSHLVSALIGRNLTVAGGVFGLERGFCLMIGGEEEVVERLHPLFGSIAPGVDADTNADSWNCSPIVAAAGTSTTASSSKAWSTGTSPSVHWVPFDAGQMMNAGEPRFVALKIFVLTTTP